MIVNINGLETKQCLHWPNYSASKCGRVFRISTRREMTQSKYGISEYMVVRTCHNNVAKNTFVHKMVASAWHRISSPLYTVVNHKDGNKLNNHADNLEWCTLSQNTKHAVATGLLGKGNQLYNSELTDEQVHEICKKLIDGALAKDLASQYNVSKDIIRKIRAGDTYFHVRQLYEIPHTYRHDFSEATIKWVCGKILEGYSDSGVVKLSTNPNLTIIEIKRIRYKIRYKYISDLFF